MRLPGNSVGITDVLTYRECPRKFAFGMRRHEENEKGEKVGDAPGDRPVHPAWHYGTVVHDGISWIEEDMLSDEEAVEKCFRVHAAWLEPEDADRLRADFETYRERDETGVILIANELEIKLPLFDWCADCEEEVEDGHCPACDGPGETIYFRGRIDRLYANAQNPSIFIHRDYKSSRWRTSEEEVHEDKQLWMYNVAIHRFWPECVDLTQWYDQLRYGDIPTSKNAQQRQQMWEWFKRQVKAILTDDILDPSANEWCPWCPIMESCSEVPRMADYARSRINELAPNSGKLDAEALEARPFEEYVAALPEIELARKMAERFEDSIRGELKKLPETRLDQLDYKKSKRKSNVWTAEALAAIHAMVGDETFYMLISMTKSRADKLLDGDIKTAVLDMGTSIEGATTVTKKT